MDNKKIRKYFIYALGEILLIVIGILIALQINNWNEKKKSRLQGEELISEINRGINSDMIELDKFISNQKQVLQSQYLFSDWLKSNNSYKDSLSNHIARSYITMDYSINYSGYETLKQFGLKRIEDDSLRASISNLYEVKYPIFLKYSEIYQKFLDELLTLNSKHFNELNYMRSTITPLQPNNLKRDIEYSYHLNTLKNFNYLLIYQATTLKKDMEKVFPAIEK